jgi:hypothetical protein
MRVLGLAACSVAALAASCALFVRDAEVSVVLPPPPAHWVRAFPDLRFRIEYRDATGVERSVEVPSGARTTIHCTRLCNSAVLGRPLCRADREGLLRPAGALVPLNETETELPLTWENGPAAVVMSRLRSLGRDTSLFNAGRLEEYMAREPDPWNLDLVGIAQKIAEGTFSAYDIERLSQRDVTVAAGAGEWFFESPFSGKAASDQSGAITARSLAVGMHGLFSAEGRALLVYVGQQECVVTAP